MRVLFYRQTNRQDTTIRHRRGYWHTLIELDEIGVVPLLNGKGGDCQQYTALELRTNKA